MDYSSISLLVNNKVASYYYNEAAGSFIVLFATLTTNTLYNKFLKYQDNMPKSSIHQLD